MVVMPETDPVIDDIAEPGLTIGGPERVDQRGLVRAVERARINHGNVGKLGHRCFGARGLPPVRTRCRRPVAIVARGCRNG